VQDPPIRPQPGHFPLSWTRAQLCPGIRLVAVAGELDILTAPVLLAALQRPENIGAFHLVIDLVGVDFLAVAGINAMIDVARRRHRHHTHLIASRTNMAVPRIIEVTGTTEILTTHPDLEQCLRLLARSGSDGWRPKRPWVTNRQH
jgi:anti-sigma B factor antagonist